MRFHQRDKACTLAPEITTPGGLPGSETGPLGKAADTTRRAQPAHMVVAAHAVPRRRPQHDPDRHRDARNIRRGVVYPTAHATPPAIRFTTARRPGRPASPHRTMQSRNPRRQTRHGSCLHHVASRSADVVSVVIIFAVGRRRSVAPFDARAQVLIIRHRFTRWAYTL